MEGRSERRAEQKGAPAAEDEEVIEVGGSTLLEDPDAQPADLDDVLRAFYENDRCLDMEGRPVSFTELLLSKDYDLQHPALEPGYVPVENVGVPGAVMANVGNVEQAPAVADTSAFWGNIFSAGNPP
jgi:hypothetical protein